MIQESGEMYLENILVLTNVLSSVRAIDLAEYMSFSKPSVSRALKILAAEDFIVIEGGGAIKLTESGRRIAENIYEKHRVLSGILMAIGVDEKTATDDACKIEHVLSDRSFEAIKHCMETHRER